MTNHICVWSPDTDVFILGIYYASQLNVKVRFKTGAKHTTRFIPLHTIADQLGLAICQLLLPFHALTGCDSTSYFKGKGKKKALELLKTFLGRFHSMAQLGDTFELSDESVHACEDFLSKL